jgi:hypothetical protein
MRYAALSIMFVLAVVAQSSSVATQPWNLPRPVLLNGCSENALIIAVKACATDSGCANGLARYENVEPPLTICCQNGRWGVMEKRQPTYCKLRARIPVKPLEVAPLR